MLSDKKLTSIKKLLGDDRMADLVSSPEEELKVIIANSAGYIKQAQDELEANPKYQDLKESLKAANSGLREIKAIHNAVIQYSLSLLEEKGKI